MLKPAPPPPKKKKKKKCKKNRIPKNSLILIIQAYLHVSETDGVNVHKHVTHLELYLEYSLETTDLTKWEMNPSRIFVDK